MRATKQRMIFLADCRSFYASAEKAVRVFCFSIIFVASRTYVPYMIRMNVLVARMLTWVKALDVSFELRLYRSECRASRANRYVN